MMIGITGFAIVCGISSTVPFFSGIVLGGLWLVLSGWLVTGMVLATGDSRAFCIGAAIVVASTWTGMGGQFLQSVQRMVMSIIPYNGGPSPLLPGSFVMWLKHLILLAAAFANGWLCIRAHRYFERHAND